MLMLSSFFSAEQCIYNLVVSVAAFVDPLHVLYNNKPSGCLRLQVVQMHTLKSSAISVKVGLSEGV